MRAVAETPAGRKIMEPTAFDDTTNSPYDVQNEPSTLSENDFEVVVQEIRDITDSAERRRRVATVPVVSKNNEQLPMSNIYCEMIDSEDRGIEDELQYPNHDAVMTDAIVEDRLLADYLHSRSRSHQENECTSPLGMIPPSLDCPPDEGNLVYLSNVKSNTALEGTHQFTEENWPQHDVTSSETLATSSRVELQPNNIRSDMTMDAESAGDISSSQRSGTAGSRQRRNSRPYYGRAVCSGHCTTDGDERVCMESDSSDQPEAATTSSQASTFIDASESTPMIRRHRVSQPSGTGLESNYFPRLVYWWVARN